MNSSLTGTLSLMLGKTEGKRRKGWQRMRWLDSVTNSMDMNFSKLWEIVKERGVWHTAIHGVSKRLGDWITTTQMCTIPIAICRDPFLCKYTFRFTSMHNFILVDNSFQKLKTKTEKTGLQWRVSLSTLVHPPNGY